MAHWVFGNEFEELAQKFFRENHCLDLVIRLDLAVGLGTKKKIHRFDLGSQLPPVIVECKCHGWTEGGNTPSAKLSVWNEAMLYFLAAPKKFRKIFVVKRSVKNDLSLAAYYLKQYGHLVPKGVEIWELDPLSGEGNRVNSKS